MEREEGKCSLCFDRLGLGNKLLTDHNAFEATFFTLQKFHHSLLKMRFRKGCKGIGRKKQHKAQVRVQLWVGCRWLQLLLCSFFWSSVLELPVTCKQQSAASLNVSFISFQSTPFLWFHDSILLWERASHVQRNNMRQSGLICKRHVKVQQPN